MLGHHHHECTEPVDGAAMVEQVHAAMLLNEKPVAVPCTLEESRRHIPTEWHVDISCRKGGDDRGRKHLLSVDAATVHKGDGEACQIGDVGVRIAGGPVTDITVSYTHLTLPTSDLV